MHLNNVTMDHQLYNTICNQWEHGTKEFTTDQVLAVPKGLETSIMVVNPDDIDSKDGKDIVLNATQLALDSVNRWTTSPT